MNVPLAAKGRNRGTGVSGMRLGARRKAGEGRGGRPRFVYWWLREGDRGLHSFPSSPFVPAFSLPAAERSLCVKGGKIFPSCFSEKCAFLWV